MADPKPINWGQVSISVILLLLSVVLSIMMVQHSTAIADNTTNIEANKREIEHLEADSLTVREREQLRASIAVLEQSVGQLNKQVQKIEKLVR
jgi:septal ring factor EnvC (AmiA/AmiB activator)